MSTTISVNNVANATVETIDSSHRGVWYRLRLRDQAGTLIAELDVFSKGVAQFEPVMWTFDDKRLNFWHDVTPVLDNNTV